MDRQSWTKEDERITWRRWAGWKHNLDDPEVLPFHLRDASRDQPQPVAPYFERARAAKHRAPAADDEEPSPVRSVTVYVVPKSTRRLRGWAVVVLVAGAMYVVVTVIRSMMGAT